MFKTNKTYIFDSFGAEMFKDRFNYFIREYGHISVMYLFEDPLLLGIDDPYLVRDLKDNEEFTKFIYDKVGWNRCLPITGMFDVRKSKRGGVFEYVLTLPDYKEL